MKTEGHILIVDDDEGVLLAARLALSPYFTQVETSSTIEGIDDRIDREAFDAVLLDMNFRPGANSGRDGLDLLTIFHRLDPKLSIVMMTAYGGVSLAVETLKAGAVDFVLKPWQNEKLVATITAAVALTTAKREADSLKLRHHESTLRPGEMVGSSAEHQKVMRQLRRVAPTETNVLVLGEPGSGRETIARELHRLSVRQNAPFVAIDVTSVPEGLLESELFGHRRGAFPGADTDRAGRLQAANGGTLYIEDIVALPLHIQRKLSATIDRGEVTAIGSSRHVAINVRLVAATQRKKEDIENGDFFHPGLLMRLRTVEIQVPPLRERRDDIAPLMEHFLAAFARRHNLPRRRMPAELLKWIEDYRWPGNIRELRQAAERATLFVGDESLRLEDFPFLFAHSARTSSVESFNLEEIERQAIARAMSHFNGNITMAAAALGLTRPALYRRLEKHGFTQ
ncbi:MAG: sigma-54 dependent transcriptional regulator [Asticcacaulis sp.]|uniref:sigma-54-dependent transcriptional regulator n=1 Tax=Asticcacaulis sp. TaxID=1872648 RepID=UPI0039E6BDE1